MADRSLRLQLLAWLLIPLAGIVIVNTWITYRNARATAGIVTDRTLLASARSMAEQVQMNNGVDGGDHPALGAGDVRLRGRRPRLLSHR